jgi:hypothetical protein
VKAIGLIAALAVLVSAPAAGALDAPETKALVRVAVRLSGLSAREPVRVVVERPARFRQRRVALLDRMYPRAAQRHDETVYRALGLAAGKQGELRRTLLGLEDPMGVYDPASRTAYVRAGAGERTAALHAIVHALQDQHADLGRLQRLPGNDARLAALASVEGYAALATQALAHAHRASQGGTRLRRFVAMKHGFVSSVGLRFTADLRYLGGSKVAIDSLRRLPVTTEQVFHLDKYLERERAVPISLPSELGGLRLAASGTFGELDVRALLAAFGVQRRDRAATGWGGGRTARYVGGSGGAVVIALDWDTPLDAAQWAQAVTVYVGKAFGGSTPESIACAASRCWRIGSRAIAFDRSGRRTALVIGADLAPVEAAARAITARG